MEFEVITVRSEVTLAAVQRYLRRLGRMPENTDKLFVIGRDNRPRWGRSGCKPFCLMPQASG